MVTARISLGTVDVATGPDPIIDPLGYEMNQVEKGVNATAQQLQQFVYDKSPDYFKAQVSLPLFPSFEVSLSKDLRLYGGGGLTNAIFDSNGFLNGARNFNFLNGERSIGFKFNASVTAGKFLDTLNAQERDAAMAGTSISGATNLGNLPLNVGLTKSLPVFGSSPTAIEAGVGLNTGVGISENKEIRFDGGRLSFGDILKRYRE